MEGLPFLFFIGHTRVHSTIIAVCQVGNKISIDCRICQLYIHRGSFESRGKRLRACHFRSVGLGAHPVSSCATLGLLSLSLARVPVQPEHQSGAVRGGARKLPASPCSAIGACLRRPRVRRCWVLGARCPARQRRRWRRSGFRRRGCEGGRREGDCSGGGMVQLGRRLVQAPRRGA